MRLGFDCQNRRGRVYWTHLKYESAAHRVLVTSLCRESDLKDVSTHLLQLVACLAPERALSWCGKLFIKIPCDHILV